MQLGLTSWQETLVQHQPELWSCSFDAGISWNQLGQELPSSNIAKTLSYMSNLYVQKNSKRIDCLFNFVSLYTVKNVFSLIGILFTTVFCQEPQYIHHNHKVENVKIQPEEALQLAEPHLDQATYKWHPERPLKTHIVKHGKYYYIMRTNYPAKTIRYYMQPAIKIHCNTGKISFVKK
ncbi:MAG: hypothetical protein AAF518_16520 [Spirochaetota bacterium]